MPEEHHDEQADGQDVSSRIGFPIRYVGGEDETILFVDQMFMRIIPGGFQLSGYRASRSTRCVSRRC